MTGVSHAITGATVALLVKEPLLALPAAFVSHFVCDAVPHIGATDIQDEIKRRKITNTVYKIDLVLILLFFAVLVGVGASWVVLAGAFLAGSPDFVWFYRYVYLEQIKKITPGPRNALSRFHSKIQWSETLRYGIPFEVVYGSLLLIFIFSRL